VKRVLMQILIPLLERELIIDRNTLGLNLRTGDATARPNTRVRCVLRIRAHGRNAGPDRPATFLCQRLQSVYAGKADLY
jgi:hypothetical protein